VWRGIHYHIGPAGRIALLGREPTKKQRQQMYDVQRARHKQDKAAMELLVATNTNAQTTATDSSTAGAPSPQPKRAA
jgi:hypothetical protein